MSRHEVYKGTKGLAFGNDHACGEYLQIWDASVYREPDGENILVDEDTFLTRLTREKMLQLIKEHGFTEDDLAEVYAQQRPK